MEAVRPGQGGLRLARTLLVAVSSAGLSASAHALAGGCVTLSGLLATSLLFGTATWTQLSRERSVRFIVGWLAVGQLLGHGLLEVFCRGAAHRVEVASSPMLALHAGAVALTALLLATGERRIWAVARRLAALPARLCAFAARRLGVSLLPAPAFELTVPPATVAWAPSLWCSLRPVRRGPPRLAPAPA